MTLFLLNTSPEKQLKLLYRNPNNCNFLWTFEENCSKLLEFSIKNIVNGKNQQLRQLAKYFIDYLAANKIAKPSDLISCCSKFKKQQHVVDFLTYLVRESLLSNDVLIAFFFSKASFSKLPISILDDWIELPIARYYQFLMKQKEGLLSMKEIFPFGLDFIPPNYIEYVLGAIFEEERLASDGEEYLEKNFPKKHQLILKLGNRNCSN